MKAYLVSDNEPLNRPILEIIHRNLYDCPPSNVVALGLAASQVENSGAHLIVLVLSPDTKVALSCLREIRKVQQTPVIAVGPAQDPKLILQAMQDGANHYVDEEDLNASLNIAVLRQREQMGSIIEPGRVIALLSASGGSGSSTLASNVATELAREHEKCALIDLNLYDGDLGALLNLKPEHSIADLCGNLDRLERSIFEQVLTVDENGVHLLASPRALGVPSDKRRRPGGDQTVTAQGVEETIKMARKLFRYIVIDVDNAFRPEQVAALQQAELVLLVLRLDYACILNTQPLYQHLQRLEIPPERIKLVVNRHKQPKECASEDAEKVLGTKIFHYIPDDPKHVNRANNSGKPVVLTNPWSPVSRSIVKMAHKLNGEAQPQAQAEVTK